MKSGCIVKCVLALAGAGAMTFAIDDNRIQAAETKVPVMFSGGHEIAKNDFGRPIPLMAAARLAKMAATAKARNSWK